MTKQELFDHICGNFSGHVQSGHSLAQTFNRLFVKHMGIPILKPDNVTITRETRPKSDFIGLLKRPDGPLGAGEAPVIIIRWGDYEGILDGNKRVRAWAKAEDQGDHTAWVVTVNEPRPAWTTPQEK